MQSVQAPGSYVSPYRGVVKHGDKFSHFDVYVDPEHQKDGYWIFSPGNEELAYQRGFRAPELLLLAELREPGKGAPDDIKLRWIPGAKDMFFPERHVSAKQHIAAIALERRLFGLPSLDTSTVPVYPCDFYGKLLHHRRGVTTVSSKSCITCHKQKERCDKAVPDCKTCVRRGKLCQYPPDGRMRTFYHPANITPGSQKSSRASKSQKSRADNMKPSATSSGFSDNKMEREPYSKVATFLAEVKEGPQHMMAAAETGKTNAYTSREIVQPSPVSSQSKGTSVEQGRPPHFQASIAALIGYDSSSDDEAGADLPEAERGPAELDGVDHITPSLNDDAGVGVPDLPSVDHTSPSPNSEVDIGPPEMDEDLAELDRLFGVVPVSLGLNDCAGIGLPAFEGALAELDSLFNVESAYLGLNYDYGATLPDLDFTINGTIDPQLLAATPYSDMMEGLTPQTDEVVTPESHEKAWEMAPEDAAILRQIGEDLAVEFGKETLNLPIPCMDCEQMEQHTVDCNINSELLFPHLSRVRALPF
ncbi:uncharacterized protein EI97DRAFT_144058 [Westerdykella ornata]|uniref:Zn(2)-C6 fungal-type domain-containing protein n=1 Tax=Westerdykella ornata TaxID=318751 RepID=A0A6A6JC07_WESOR|nr:uncharacterized protein EI97DRAFT_144058 [Westerdykella ornata]KAF2273797.1 hypothetical protein EI97DRAFT_144058 [Westerdykella ornata]